MSSARPVARSVRPTGSRAESGRSSKAFFALAAALLAGTALWAFNSKDKTSPQAATEPQAAPTPAHASPALAATPAAQAKPTAVPGAHQLPAGPNEVQPSTAPATTPANTAPAGVDAPTAVTPTTRAAQAGPKNAPLAHPAIAAPKAAPRQHEGANDDSQAQPAASAFPVERASQALTAAAVAAGGCRQVGDPTGVARVEVTFAPSGHVTAATVKGKPFAGTRTGSCIAKRMRDMVIPPFQGELVTIGKTVTIM